jgi:3-phenylpropionate/trans-cinnamate dioxygenase ferredoxin subunit
MSAAFAEVMPAAELRDGKAVRAESPWGPLLVYRHAERVFAISNVCTHMGASLHRGSINTQTTTPMATCPAHGSMFDLATGRVRRGPAMQPVATYEARIDGEHVVARPLADAV